MKKTYIILLLSCLFGLLSCGPSKEEMEAREKEVMRTSNKKYKVGDIVYLKPDSCKGLVIGFKPIYTFYNDTAPAISYLMRDCHGQEVLIDTDNFIYGKEY